MRIPLSSKCQTVGCSSTEVESVNVGPPDVVPVQPDLLQYQYDGYCPACHVPCAGVFWVKRDSTTRGPGVHPE